MARPPKTSLDQILQAAETLLDAPDAPDFSLRALARTLDLAAPSLLAHVGDFAALCDRLRVRAASALAVALAEDEDGAAGVMNAWRAFASEHPGRYALLAQAPAVLTSTAVVQAVSVRLRDADGVRTLAFISALHGLATLQAAGGLGTPWAADAVAIALLPARQAEAVAGPSMAPPASTRPPRSTPEGFRTPRLRLGGRS